MGGCLYGTFQIVKRMVVSAGNVGQYDCRILAHVVLVAVDRRLTVSLEEIRTFQNLVEKNFSDLRLPGAYADLLNITPNHLNALTKEHLGKQAGEVIRERIVLAAATTSVVILSDSMNGRGSSRMESA